MINVNLFDLVADLTELKDYVGDSIKVIIEPNRIIFDKIHSSCDEHKLEEIIDHMVSVDHIDSQYELRKNIKGYWVIEIVI